MEFPVDEAPSAVVFGPAVPADAPALLEVQRRVLAEGLWFITEPDELQDTVEQKLTQIREAARADRSLLYVARRRNRVVGWVHVVCGPRRRALHVGRIEIMVDAPHRRRGIGKGLLAAVIAWAERHPQVVKLSLTVFAHNEAAVALYRSMGFVEEGRRIGEYRVQGELRDELLMARFVRRPQPPT